MSQLANELTHEGPNRGIEVFGARAALHAAIPLDLSATEVQDALREQLERIIAVMVSSAEPARELARSLRERLRLSEHERRTLAEPLVLGRLSLNLAGHEVYSAGHRVHVTYREFALLAYLAEQRGRVCRREEIVANVWRDRALTSSRTVDIHVYRLRTKLGEPFAELLETIRHVGYKLRVRPSEADGSVSTILSRPEREAQALAREQNSVEARSSVREQKVEET